MSAGGGREVEGTHLRFPGQAVLCRHGEDAGKAGFSVTPQAEGQEPGLTRAVGPAEGADRPAPCPAGGSGRKRDCLCGGCRARSRAPLGAGLWLFRTARLACSALFWKPQGVSRCPRVARSLAHRGQGR